MQFAIRASILVFAAIVACAFPSTSRAQVHVRGHYRNGTWVAPYMRSSPDRASWSTAGNVNPYTLGQGSSTEGDSPRPYRKQARHATRPAPRNLLNSLAKQAVTPMTVTADGAETESKEPIADESIRVASRVREQRIAPPLSDEQRAKFHATVKRHHEDVELMQWVRDIESGRRSR